MKKIVLILIFSLNLISKDYVLDHFFPEIKEPYFNGLGSGDIDLEGYLNIGGGLGGLIKITKDGHIFARYPIILNTGAGPISISSKFAIDSEGSIYGAWSIRSLGSWLFKLNKKYEMVWAIQQPKGGTPFYETIDVAVDLEDNVYVSDSKNCRVVKLDKDGNFIKEFGGPNCGDPWTPNPSPLYNPTGITVDPQGNLYVADSGNCRVAVFDKMGNLIKSIGERGNGPGQFEYPMWVVLDSSGNIYVSDGQIINVRIEKFNSNGQFIKEWGGKGLENGKFMLRAPSLMIVDNKIYASDWRRMQIFDLDGNFIKSWASGGIEEGKFWLPKRVEVDNSGNIYVLDTYNNRVQKFDRRGNFISSFGGYGTEEGKFNLPEGLAIDDEGSIYVADTGNNRLQKFSKKFEYLGKIDFYAGIADVACDRNGYVYVLFQYGGIYKYDKNLNFVKRLPTNPYGRTFQAYGICIDNTFNYYVSNDTREVYKFDSEGNYLGFYGGEGEGDGKFKRIGDVAVSNTGLLFVSDDEKGISVFDTNFNFLTSFGDSGSDLERLWGFKGVAVQNNGEVVASEQGANRVSIWKPKKGSSALIPAVAKKKGAFGKYWRSDLFIFNKEENEIDLNLKFYSAYGNLYERSIKLQAKGAKKIEDILGSIFNLEEDFGYLEVSNEYIEPPVINSRVYTGEDKSFGQGINGFYLEDTFTEIDEVYFNGLKNNERFHTNLGFLNLRDSPLEVEIEYFNSFGNLIKEEKEIIDSRGFKQKNFILNEYFPVEFYIKIKTNTIDSRWIAYTSIVDNRTGDGVFQRGQKRNCLLKEQWELIVPAVASNKGGYKSYWKTELNLTNGGEEDMEVEFKYYSSTKGESFEKRIEIKKGESHSFEDFLVEFFGIEEEFGFLIIKPEKNGVLLSTRVYTEEVGTYGQEIPAVEFFRLEGKEKYLTGAEERENFRTNLGIIPLSVSDVPIPRKFNLVLIKDGQEISEKEIELEENKLTQFNSFLKNLFNIEGEGFTIKIISEEAKFFAYLSKIDNKSQDPIFIYN